MGIAVGFGRYGRAVSSDAAVYTGIRVEDRILSGGGGGNHGGCCMVSEYRQDVWEQGFGRRCGKRERQESMCGGWGSRCANRDQKGESEQIVCRRACHCDPPVHRTAWYVKGWDYHMDARLYDGNVRHEQLAVHFFHCCAAPMQRVQYAAVFGVFVQAENEVLTAALLFGASTIAGISMLAVYDSRPAVCVVMMMLITGCMFGVNLMLISRLPGHFAGRGNVSTVSGILNAATYVGSALSTYVFGAVAESAGWKTVVVLWGTAALGGTLLLLSGIWKWGCFGSAENTANDFQE